jgi:hypothetical protein
VSPANEATMSCVPVWCGVNEQEALPFRSVVTLQVSLAPSVNVTCLPGSAAPPSGSVKVADTVSASW